MTGKQLRKFRKDNGASTAAAARMVGVARRTWVRWESLPKVPEMPAKLVRLLWHEKA